MAKYTHIILDEVHERSAEADFLCLVVRNLLAELDCLTKVILMSATLEGSLYSHYFQMKGLVVSTPLVVGGRQFPVDEYFLDHVADHKEQLVVEHEGLAPTTGLLNLRQQARKRAAKSSYHLVSLQNSEWKKKLRSDDPRIAICCDLIFSQAKLGEGTLVFVPGFDELMTVYEALSYKITEHLVARHFKVFLLHSQVPMSEQREAFEEPAADVAHILLATNVAESSLTIPKLRLVINFCLRRGLRYDTRRQMSMLDLDWCSHASCKQRAGRAGRVFPGVAIHLVSKRFHDKDFPPYDEPEMRTASLPRIFLEAKVLSGYLRFAGPSELLMDTLTPPSDMNVKNALTELHRIGAFSADSEEEGYITVLGYFSLSLPVDLSLCRLILFGICFECPDAAIIMAAGLTMRQDVFSAPLTFMNSGAYHHSLWLSAKTRWKYDHGQYSEPHMYVKLFRDWMDFKVSERKKSNLFIREELARSFVKGKGVSWERLLQLENTVGDIAQRTKKFVPQECKLFAQLDQLSQLGKTSAASRFGAMGSLAMSTDVAEGLKVHGDPVTYKILLVAAFSHNLLIGQAEFLEDSTFGENASQVEKDAREEGINLKDESTLYMRPFHKAEKHVQEAVESVTDTDLLQVAQRIVWERKHIQTWCFGKGEEMTAVVKFHTSFESNPKTEQMRRYEGGSQRESMNFANFPSQVITPEAMLQCDAVITWQFGLRRQTWAAGSIRNLPRVLHPCSAAFHLISNSWNFVLADGWRNPVGVACDVKNTAPFYAVAASLIGMGAITKAKGMCILPRLGKGDSAMRPILMTLAFLDFHRDVQFRRVESDPTKFSAILIDGCELRCPSGQCISLAHIMMINRVRKALSEVMSQTNHSFLPIDRMTHIRPLIRSLLTEELVVNIVNHDAEEITADDEVSTDIAESPRTSTDTDSDDSDDLECDETADSHLWQSERWRNAGACQFPLFASVVPTGATLVKREMVEQSKEHKTTTRRLAPSVPWRHRQTDGHGQDALDHREHKEPVAKNSSDSSDSEEETMLSRQIDEDVQRLRRITSALPSSTTKDSLLSTVSGAAPHTEESAVVPVFSVGCTDAPEASSDEDSDGELSVARKKDRLVPGQIAKDKSRWPQRIVSAIICIIVQCGKKDYIISLNKLKSGKNSPFTPLARPKVLVEFFRQIPRIFQLKPEAKVYFKQADPTLKEIGEKERLVDWLDKHHWCVNVEATKKLSEEFQQVRVARPKTRTVVRQLQVGTDQAVGAVASAPNPYELLRGLDEEETQHQSRKPTVKKRRSAEGSAKASPAKPLTMEEQTVAKILKSLVDTLQQKDPNGAPWDKVVQCASSPFAESASREAVEGLCLCFREFLDVIGEGGIKLKQHQLPEQPMITSTILCKYRKWKKTHRAALKVSFLTAEKL